MARTSSWTGLPSVIPQVARGSPILLASCSTSTVSSAARPGATIFGPPEKPAKKCGSTNPVVIRASASTHSSLSQTGTPSPNVPIQRCVSPARESWLTIRTVSTTWSPNIARSSGLGVGPVGAGGDQDDDVREVDDAVELLEHRWDHQLPGLR